MSATVELPQSPPYLTVIPDRHPVQKVHTDLGQAKKAISFRAWYRLTVPISVYEWDNGWKLKWQFAAGTYREDLPWV